MQFGNEIRGAVHFPVRRLLRAAVALFAALAAGFVSADEGVAFAHRPMLAGKASLTILRMIGNWLVRVRSR